MSQINALMAMMTPPQPQEQPVAASRDTRRAERSEPTPQGENPYDINDKGEPDSSRSSSERRSDRFDRVLNRTLEKKNPGQPQKDKDAAEDVSAVGAAVLAAEAAGNMRKTADKGQIEGAGGEGKAAFAKQRPQASAAEEAAKMVRSAHRTHENPGHAKEAALNGGSNVINFNKANTKPQAADAEAQLPTAKQPSAAEQPSAGQGKGGVFAKPGPEMQAATEKASAQDPAAKFEVPTTSAASTSDRQGEPILTQEGERAPLQAANGKPDKIDAESQEQTKEPVSSLLAGDKQAAARPPAEKPDMPAVKATGEMTVDIIEQGPPQGEPGGVNRSEGSAETVRAAAVRGADAVSQATAVDQIAGHVQLSRAGAYQQIRLTLSPAELGAVRITFRQTDGEMVGMVEVEKTQTRRDLEESMPQLMSAMQNQGLQVRRIEVVPWTAANQSAKEGPGDEFNSSQRHWGEWSQSDASGHRGRRSFEDSGTEAADPLRRHDAYTGDNGPQQGLNIYI